MAEEFKGINNETLRQVQSVASSMKDIETATRSANRSLEKQGSFLAAFQASYTAINSSVNKFAEIQDKSRKSAAATSDAIKEQQKQLSVVRTLNAQIDNLYKSMLTSSEEEVRVIKRQVENLSSARDNAKELSRYYTQLADDSSKLDKSTLWFSSLSEVVKDIPGLRKLSSPFEEAAKAARETVLSNAKIKSSNESIASLGKEALKNGKGLTKEKLKELGLAEIVGDKTGAAAANVLKTYQAQNKVQNVTIAGLKAGFAELGPIISQAFGPIAILTTVISGIKALVGTMFAVDKQVVSLGKNLQISYENAQKVRDYFDDVKDSLNTQYKLTENIIEAQLQLSNLSATTGLYSEEALETQIKLTKEYGLSLEEANSLNKFSIAYGKNNRNILTDARQATVEYAKQNKLQFRIPDILRQASKVSGELLLSFKGSEKALFNATMNANKLGVSIEKTKDISNSLLNFEESISSELEAELLTGKDINLDLARSLALQGDFVGATEAALSNISSIAEFEEMNTIQRKAFAKALGMTTDELADALIQQSLITEKQKQQYEIFKKAGDEETALAFAKGELDEKALQIANERINAEERFQIQLNRAKETFASFVDSGMLQNLADIVEDLVDTVKGTDRYKTSIEQAQLKTGTTLEPEQSKRIDELVEMAKGPSKFIVALNSLQKFVTGGVGGIDLSEQYATADAAKEELKTIRKNIESNTSKEGFGGAGGAFASGGIVPSGFPNDTYRARLSSNEAVIPLDQLMAKFDAMTNAIASNKQSVPKIYLGTTELNTATAMNTYALNEGVTS